MDNTTVIPSFTENLKSATAAAHTALEALPVSASIMSPELTKDAYITYLTLMRDVVRDAENNVFTKLTKVIPEIAKRNKTHLIEQDLLWLGAPLTDNKKPLSGTSVSMSEGFAMGIFYVIEGSSLGGRVLLKNITKTLGYTETQGTAYFEGYGTLTGPMWKQFVQLLSQYETENNNSEEIINGANFAFKAIHQHFSQE